MTFRLAPAFEVKRSDHPNGHREYEVICTLNDRFQGVGACSTMEGKFRYRTGPKEFTGNPVPKAYWDLRGSNPAKAIELLGGKGFSVGKNEAGMWEICIAGEKVEHDNPADYYNTVLKMAKKRAHVDAILTATAASDIFVQDLEEMPEVIPGAQEPPVARQAPKTTPTPPPAPNRAPEAKPAAKTADVVPPKEATDATRAWFVQQVEGAGLTNEFLAYGIDKGCIMPNEGMEDWSLSKVPTSRPDYLKLTKLVEDYSLGKSGLAPEQKGDADFSEAFWDVIITVPRKGMKKADYIREPDTIKSLYCATKTGDEDAQNRLFGMANKWKPEPYEYNGKTYQPSDADHKCRAALDNFLSWEDERATK